MSSTLIRRGFATATVGALVAAAVALGGPARAADDGPAGKPPKDTATIGCAVAVEMSADAAQAAEAAQAVEVPAGANVVVGVSGVTKVEAGTIVATGSQVPDGPVASFQVDVDQLPDCDAAG